MNRRFRLFITSCLVGQISDLPAYLNE